MAEETAEQVEQTEQKPKQKNTLLYILIGVLFLIIIGMGAGAYLYISGQENPNQEEVKKVEKVEKSEAEAEVIEKATEELIVNIQGKGRTYLKIKMTLIFDAETFDEEKYTKKTPYITDTIIGVLSSKVREEISTFGGKVDLKDELRTKLNVLLPKELEVSKILFTTFVIQ